ncbi:MAG TPA: hypothetical protein VFV37_08525 [Luteibaculaceae bacterium]|nr:hypothetical protein [Luteibaculaceae bacterium]
MTEFLLLFRNASAANGYLATSEQMAADMPRWQNWIAQIAQQGKLVSTAPMQYEAAVVSQDGIAQGHPVKDATSVLVSGYLICKGESLAEIEEWSKGCPVLQYPSSSVEIRPLVSFPVN